VRPDATAPSCSASIRTPVATSCREARSATSRSAVVRTLKQTASTESSGGSKETSAVRSGGGVRIEAEHDGAVASGRTWLHPRYFSVRDLVDRVHWQLQGSSSLRSRQDAGSVRAPVERVRFLPEVVEPAAAHTEGLWGGSGVELVERGVARVQAMVGFDAVTRPVLQGGRGPADRQAAVTWGERATALRPLDRPWPGRLPGPAPCRVFSEPLTVEVRDDAGREVAVTDRGVVSGAPTRFRLDGSWQPVVGWAGPWPVDESWWSEGGGHASRFQLVGADGRAWLMACGPQGWRVEAGYD